MRIEERVVVNFVVPHSRVGRSEPVAVEPARIFPGVMPYYHPARIVAIGPGAAVEHAILDVGIHESRRIASPHAVCGGPGQYTGGAEVLGLYKSIAPLGGVEREVGKNKAARRVESDKIRVIHRERDVVKDYRLACWPRPVDDH